MSSPRPKRPDPLSRWSRLAIPAAPAGGDAVRRDRLVGAIAETMQRAAAAESVRRRRRLQIAWALGIAALFLLGIGGWRQWATRGPLAPRSRVANAGRVAVDGVATVATRAESASGLRLPSGVVVTMKPETHFQMSDPSVPSNMREEINLELGRVQVDVPKLAEGHTFAVRTPDTLVTVHGTSFSVEVTKTGASGATSTTVAVTRGVVSVLHDHQETFLYAGMEWSSSAQLSVATEPAEPPVRLAAKPRSPSLATGAARVQEHKAVFDRKTMVSSSNASDPGSTPEATSRGTDLANANVLFAEAKLARKQGDQARAVRLLGELIRRYPASPLIEDAQVETFRALAQEGDHAGAAHEARRYLTLYRSGFARDEARAMALDPAADSPDRGNLGPDQ